VIVGGSKSNPRGGPQSPLPKDCIHTYRNGEGELSSAFYPRQARSESEVCGKVGSPPGTI
jgi:hypothetical protein